MDVSKLNVEELFDVMLKEIGERAATILKDNGVTGAGLLQLTDDEAKEIFPVLGDRLSVRAFITASISRINSVSFVLGI